MDTRPSDVQHELNPFLLLDPCVTSVFWLSRIVCQRVPVRVLTNMAANNNSIDPTMGKDAASTKEMNEVERVMSGEELSKDHQDYGRMDAEVAKYATGEQVDISESENKR